MLVNPSCFCHTQHLGDLRGAVRVAVPISLLIGVKLSTGNCFFCHDELYIYIYIENSNWTPKLISYLPLCSYYILSFDQIKSQCLLDNHVDSIGDAEGLGTSALAPERASSSGILSKSLRLGSSKNCTGACENCWVVKPWTVGKNMGRMVNMVINGDWW